MGVARMLGGCY